MGREAVDEARTILLSGEPDLRRYPMVRYRFAAYEPLDNALAALRFPGYVAIRRRERGGRIGQHRYYLLSEGRIALRDALAEVPDLGGTWIASARRPSCGPSGRQGAQRPAVSAA